MESVALDSLPGTRTLLLGTFLLLMYLLFVYESKATRFLKQFPGPPTYPLLGNSLYFAGRPEDYLYAIEHFPKTFGNRVRIILGPLKMLLLFDPVDIEKVLGSTTMINKSRIYDYVISSVGLGLPFSSGKMWQTRRKLLTPAFHFKNLESFHTIFYEQSKIMLEVLKGKVGQGEAVDIFPMISRCALDVICETSMGKKLNCQWDTKKPLAQAFMRATAYVSERMISPWLYPEFIFTRSSLGRKERANRLFLIEFINTVIQERRTEILRDRAKKAESNVSGDGDTYANPKNKFAFLDLLINLQLNGEGDLSDKDIFDETVSFMIGGHDTTAISTTWTLFLLSQHPEEQDKVQAELDDVFKDERNRPITSGDLAELKYLDCVIKESLRIFPSAPVIGRKVEEAFALDENTIVPAGLEIVMYPYFTHRHPKYFPDPEVFRPSRFFPENCVGRHPCAYIPFSAGPRNCVGWKYALTEEKVILTNLLRHYRVTCTNPEKLRIKFELFIRPKHDLLFKFEPMRK